MTFIVMRLTTFLQRDDVWTYMYSVKRAVERETNNNTQLRMMKGVKNIVNSLHYRVYII